MDLSPGSSPGLLEPEESWTCFDHDDEVIVGGLDDDLQLGLPTCTDSHPFDLGGVLSDDFIGGMHVESDSPAEHEPPSAKMPPGRAGPAHRRHGSDPETLRRLWAGSAEEPPVLTPAPKEYPHYDMDARTASVQAASASIPLHISDPAAYQLSALPGALSQRHLAAAAAAGMGGSHPGHGRSGSMATAAAPRAGGTPAEAEVLMAPPIYGGREPLEAEPAGLGFHTRSTDALMGKGHMSHATLPGVAWDQVQHYMQMLAHSPQGVPAAASAEAAVAAASVAWEIVASGNGGGQQGPVAGPEPRGPAKRGRSKAQAAQAQAQALSASASSTPMSATSEEGSTPSSAATAAAAAASRARRRGQANGYLCSKCGLPKKGHVCTAMPRLVSAGIQVDVHVTAGPLRDQTGKAYEIRGPTPGVPTGRNARYTELGERIITVSRRGRRRFRS